MEPERTTPSGAQPLREVAVHLHADDHVAIAKTNLTAGTTLVVDAPSKADSPSGAFRLGTTPVSDPGELITVRQFVPSGHKVAVRELAAGQPVRRYGQVIGLANRPIKPGEHVHTHNLSAEDFARRPEFGVDVQRVSYVPEPDRRTFLGYKRSDGRVGTRNYLAVISTVNCSAHASREIARHFTSERMATYPNVDGVMALTHPLGCPIHYELLRRTLVGMARHPNIAACILVGLGCETTQVADLMRSHGLLIQDLGGIAQTVRSGIAAIKDLLPTANAVQRTSQPISELTLALQCGGSDAWSGVSANPLVGLLADEIVRQGGTVVLAETPEVYGAEHLLTRRAISPEVGEKLLAQVRWWQQYAQRMGIEIDDNRSVGNEAGGLTTIYEKSLGAVSKAGSTPLTGVYEYAEPVTTRGFVFMNSPGYDPVSVTGQVAGGCNLVLFTTGRGSVFGFKPAPCIKISSNSATYKHMMGDMDLNAGKLLEAGDMEGMAAELLDLVVAVASGQVTKSEAQGVGEAEFNPWNLEGTL